MATLQDRLDAIRKGFESKAPAEALAIMHRVTEDLKASGIEQNAVSEGAEAPSFVLPDQNGNDVSLADLLARGPLVLSFFRGHW